LKTPDSVDNVRNDIGMACREGKMEDIKDNIVLHTRDAATVFRLLTPESLLATVWPETAQILAASRLS
jgi:hypothetical protein